MRSRETSGAPQRDRLSRSARRVERGLNFTLTTRLGDLDLLAEIAGGTYESLIPQSQEMELFGLRCRVVSLSGLIRLKRAAGRPKDLEALAELEAIQEAAQ